MTLIKIDKPTGNLKNSLFVFIALTACSCSFIPDEPTPEEKVYCQPLNRAVWESSCKSYLADIADPYDEEFEDCEDYIDRCEEGNS